MLRVTLIVRSEGKEKGRRELIPINPRPERAFRRTRMVTIPPNCYGGACAAVRFRRTMPRPPTGGIEDIARFGGRVMGHANVAGIFHTPTSGIRAKLPRLPRASEFQLLAVGEAPPLMLFGFSRDSPVKVVPIWLFGVRNPSGFRGTGEQASDRTLRKSNSPVC